MYYHNGSCGPQTGAAFISLKSVPKEQPVAAGKCDLCGKIPQFGHNVSHSHRKTNRMWRPNTHRTTVTANGTSVRLNACTRCLRTMSKTRA